MPIYRFKEDRYELQYLNESQVVVIPFWRRTPFNWRQAEGVKLREWLMVSFDRADPIIGEITKTGIKWENDTEWVLEAESKASEPSTIDLLEYERTYTSQSGEDGLIEKIFKTIRVTDKFYLEFGVEDGIECNTRRLREKFGWQGIMWDGDHENKEIGLYKEFITRENILDLCKRHKVPRVFDLLSLDVDFNDWHILRELLKEHRPRVIVCEYNGGHLVDEDKVVPYDPQGKWDGTNFFGASLLAINTLLSRYDYDLVGCTSRGVNAFFVQRQDLDEVYKLSQLQFKHAGDLKALYTPAKYGPGPNGGHMADPKKREFTSAKTLLGQ